MPIDKEPTVQELEEIIATSEAVDAYIERLEIYVERHVRKIKQELENADNEYQAAAILARLSPELLPQYLLDQIDKVTKLYDLEMRHIKRRFAITDDDSTLAFQIAKSERNRVKNEIITTMSLIGSALALSTIGRQRKGTSISLPELEQSYVATKLRQVNAQTITILYGFRSGMEIKKGTEEALSEKKSEAYFEYFGPQDAKNRPFCRDIIARGRLFTALQIKELDKHPDAQLLPVSVFCGGYNCRHIWFYRGYK